MRTPSTILLVAIVAAGAVFVTYEVIKKQVGALYAFETPDCKRVKLKDGITEFKSLVKRVGKEGSVVNLRYQPSPGSDEWITEKWKFGDKDFEPTTECTDGTHHTQSVTTANLADMQQVIDSIDLGATAPTPTPTPTPGP